MQIFRVFCFLLSNVYIADRSKIQSVNKGGIIMLLREYLKAIKIDEIEDDREFCEEEYNVVHDYCDGQKYCLSEDDKNVINERGLQDSFSVWKWNYIIELWREFGDIPMNPDTECIEEEWNDFSIGTHREEIWHWFEETFNISVGKDLMGF